MDHVPGGIAVAEHAEQGITLTFDLAWYEPEAIQRAAHAFTGRCYVHLESASNESVMVRLFPKQLSPDVCTPAALAALVGEFGNAVLDHTLRIHLKRETNGIRNVLIAQAFSQVDLLHPELAAVQPGSDHLGVSRPDRPHDLRSR